MGRLSGGEQARALVARLVLEPADVLLLDEPKDIPTLEVLESLLCGLARREPARAACVLRSE